MVSLTGSPSLTFAPATGGGETITRSTGSWITDGFQAGQTINVVGTADSNSTYTIVSVTPGVLTVTSSNSPQARDHDEWCDDGEP